MTEPTDTREPSETDRLATVPEASAVIVDSLRQVKFAP